MQLVQSPRGLGLLGFALAALAGASPANECQRLVDVFGPTTYQKGHHEATFQAPVAQGARFFLTAELSRGHDRDDDDDDRDGKDKDKKGKDKDKGKDDDRDRDWDRDHGDARVILNGQVVVRERDFSGDDVVRLEVPISEPTNRLRIRVKGSHRLTLKIQGIVPEAALPPGVGKRVAEVTLFQQVFFGRKPIPRFERTRITVPTANGIFSLRIAQGSPAVLLASLSWNGDEVMGPLPIRPGHSSSEALVSVRPGPNANTLDTLVLGSNTSRVIVALKGWIVDEAAPNLAWTSPANGSEVAPTTPLRVEYSDALSGVDTASLRVLLDGTTDVSAAFSVGSSAAQSTVAAVASLSPLPPGSTHTLQARVRDRACNEAQASVTFRIPGAPDVTPPVLTQPPDLVVEQTSPQGAVVTYTDPTATDDRDPTPIVVCSPPSGSLFPPGLTIVTCTATDDANNSSSVTFRITVRDTTPPAITTPGDLVVEQTSPQGAVVNYAATATDAADPAPVASCNPPSGSVFPGGVTIVTCTARDSSNNESTATFQVTVRDTTPPLLTQPDEVIAEQTSPAGTIVTYVDPLATDAVDTAPVVSCSPASGSFFPPGPTTVTCTARDASGNQGQVTFTVLVRDRTPPSLALTPTDGAVVTGPSVSFSAQYADPVSGVNPGSFVATVDSRDETARFTVGPDRADANFVVTEPPPPSPRTPPDEAPLLELATEPRSFDGSNNDLANPNEGRAGVRLLRELSSDYADGISTPAGNGRPSARAVSNAVHAQGPSLLNKRHASDWIWIWGQFLDHDLSLTRGHTPPESFPIQVPEGDPFFDPDGDGGVLIPLNRSRYDPSSSPREQTNELTAWVDASMVYGSSAARAHALRTNDGTGRLKTSAGNLLPFNTTGLDNAPSPFAPNMFVAGDIRANETVPLIMIHTLWVREHNRLADLLKAKFPTATDDQIFEGARKIVAAEIQAISYQEFLPTLLGPNALGPYAGYDPSLNAGVENAFANAAFRLGHTLLSPRLKRVNSAGALIPEGFLELRDSFFVPERLTDGGGMEPLILGSSRQLAQELDPMVVDEVRNFLFGQPGQGGLDLPALNIQRGRDHGLPTYNNARRQLGLAPRTSFEEVTTDQVRQARLRRAYKTVEEIELWPGGLSEDQVPGSMVGELFQAMFVRQFTLLREGDRFYYEREFSGAALQALRDLRLADVIRRNTTLGSELQDEVFTAAAVHVFRAEIRDNQGNLQQATSAFTVAPDTISPVALEVAVVPGPASAVPVVTENALSIRAVTQNGDTAFNYSGFALVSASDGRGQLDGLLVQITEADQGRVTIPRVAFFETLGTVVVTARTVVVNQGDLDLSGSLSVNVILEQPVIYPPPPAVIAAGQELVVQGYAPPGESVELVVDGQVVATAIAGVGGTYTLTAQLAVGQHQVQTRARDPVTGVIESSPVVAVEVQPPPTVALIVTPEAPALGIGQTLQLSAVERFATGAERSVTDTVTWESLSPGVASVDAAGLVQGLTTGQAVIRATLVAAFGGTFTDESTVSVGAPVLVESSPTPGEAAVAVTRETILRFSAPLDPTTITSQAIFASFGGENLTGRLHVSPDRTIVTLFYDEHLPASSKVRVTVVGALLRDELGNVIDADRDGQPGGTALIDFDTHSITVVPGTVVCGRVFASELAAVGTESVTIPLEGVKISVEGAEDTLFAFTDALGNWRLDPSPAGKFFVLIDGRTAVNNVPVGSYYPPVGKSMDVLPGVENNMRTTYLPIVRPGTLQPLSDTEPTVIRFTEDTQRDFPWLAGTQVIVPPGSPYFNDGTPGQMVGIAPVPPDRLPGRLPPDLPFRLVITVQTDGATNFDTPIAVRFPNLEGLAPGEKTALWSFNHDTGNWEVVGSMTVTPDGLYVETDPGVGIRAPGWHSWTRGVQGDGAPPGEGEEPEDEEGMPDGPPECPSDSGDADCACKDPQDGSVILSTGEERLDRVDLMIPGRAGMNFVMSRRYRSKLTYDGPLGQGWDFDFNEKLFIRDNGDVARMSGGGRNDLWVRQANGSFLQPVGFFGTLKQRQDGVYVLTERDGMRRLYQPNGKLFCWLDRFGNQMGFEHDHCGDLDFVLDCYGRQIDFTFTEFSGGKRRLTRITDFAGREVIYSYDQAGNLVSVRAPVVTGTSTGNDFPAGRTEQYGYYGGSDPKLAHNLVSITAPEEVARGGPPWLVLTYGTDSNDPLTYDKVIQRQEGGTNASGVPAGGITTYAYSMLNQGVPMGNPDLPRGQATITDRNGNVLHYFVNEKMAHILTRQFTRGLRPGEPEYYETRSFFDEDGQLVRRVFPEGNELRITYDRSSGRRAAVKNVLEQRLVAGPRGDGRGAAAEDIVTTFTYEPLFNQVLTITDPRGNSPSFNPPISPETKTPERYRTSVFYDYQENSDPVPFAVELGIDLSGITRGLGDLNGDGRTDQVAGNPVRTQSPTVHLDPTSNQALAMGSNLQAVMLELVWNDRGQRIRQIDAEGNVTVWLFHPDNDPDGDGVLTDSPWRRLTNAPTGYPQSMIVDAVTSPRRTFIGTPLALATTYRYDTVGNLTRAVNPRGVATTFELNAVNEVVAITRGADVTEAVTRGQLITGEQAFGYRLRRIYDHNGRVIRVEQENRDGSTEGVGSFVEASSTFDILNFPVEMVQEIDATTRLTTTLRYDPNENLVQTTAPEGNQVVTAYDERDLVLAVTRGAGATEAATVTFDYNLNGQLVRNVDAEDTDGDGSAEVALLRRLDGFDRPIEVVDALGNMSSTVFDPVSNPVRTQVLGHPPAAPSDPQVLLAHIDFSHDELKRAFRSDASLFLSSGFAPVRPVQLQDHDGDGKVTTRVEFDALSRPTFAIEDDGEVSRSFYDGASRVIATQDALGNRVERIHDRNNNPVLVRSIEISPDGLVPAETFVARYAYDQLDRLVRGTDNVGQTSRFAYDSRDNLVLRSDPEGPQTSDPLGLFPGQINGPGNTCRYIYDGLNRMIREVCDLRVGGTGAGALDTANPRNPDGQISVSYVFDGNSRLTGMVDDNGNRTSFGYDALDRNVSQTNADGELSLSTFDRDGNVRTVTDPNGTVMTKTYDVLNRLIQCDVLRATGVAGTTRQTFAYDGLSRLVRATDDNGGPAAQELVERVYDSLGRVLEERQSGRVVSRVFTGDGKRAQLTYPGGRTITRTFDAIDRIKTLADPLGQLARSEWIGPGLRELRRINRNGTQLSFLNDAGDQDIGFDGVQRLIRLRVLGAGGTAIVDREYAYNRAYQRTLERRNDDLGLTDSYTYDSAYRVVASAFDQAGPPDAIPRDVTQISYRYDGVGNRRETTKVTSAGTVSETYAVNVMNEYTSIGPVGTPVARVHDDNGNLVDDNSRLLIWDALNRLVFVARKSDGAPVAQYFYLPDGRRSRKITYSQTIPGLVERETRYAWDGGQEVEEQSATGVTLATYVWSPVYVDELIEFKREAAHPLGAGSFYAHHDARSDVVAVTDQGGLVVEKRRYDDFGREEIRDGSGAILSGSPSGLEYGFQGRRRDSETGWLYFRARMYDPEAGRFLSRDMVWDAANVGNQYSFVGNGPASRLDPTGDAGFMSGFAEGAQGAVAGLWNSIKDIANFDFSKLSASQVAEVLGGALLAGLESILPMLACDLAEKIAKYLIPGALAASLALVVAQALWDAWWDDCGSFPYRFGKALGKGLMDFGLGLIGGKLAGVFFKNVGKALNMGNHGGCFLAGTMVMTKAGAKPIEDIQVGDEVVSRNQHTGDLGYKRVARLFRGQTDRVVYLRIAKAPSIQRGRSEGHRVGVATGGEEGEGDPDPDPDPDAVDEQQLRSTCEHPFWVEGLGWVAAQDLRAGDRLLDSKGEQLVIVGHEVRREVANHFNFEVESWHTYFVSETERDPAIWVHNNCVKTGKGRDHVTYRGTKTNPDTGASEPYTGYASAPSSDKLTPKEIVDRRYGGDPTSQLEDVPEVVYFGKDVQGKQTARGLEQHYYEQDVAAVGKENVANRQNPVGPNNDNRDKYKAAAEKYLEDN